MKVEMIFCERCGTFFKVNPLKQFCPECLGKDMLRGPYLVDEYEYDINYRKQKIDRRK